MSTNETCRARLEPMRRLDFRSLAVLAVFAAAVSPVVLYPARSQAEDKDRTGATWFAGSYAYAVAPATSADFVMLPDYFTLGSVRTQQELGLTDAQKRKLREIAEAYRKELGNIGRDTPKEYPAWVKTPEDYRRLRRRIEQVVAGEVRPTEEGRPQTDRRRAHAPAVKGAEGSHIPRRGPRHAL